MFSRIWARKGLGLLLCVAVLLLGGGAVLRAQTQPEGGVRYSRPNRPVEPLSAEELARQRALNGNINFASSLLLGEMNEAPTSLQFGPDGRLYAADVTGYIYVYTITRTDAGQYQVTNTETITAIRDIPNHNDDGTPNPPDITDRQILGIVVGGTAGNPILYVSSSDPRIGGSIYGETGLDTNSGVVSRLTQSIPGSWVGVNKLDLVRGLPRSEENHAVNGMQLSADGHTLFLAVGGNTNMGAPSASFAHLPEYALAAAVLSIDLNAIGNSTYDLPTLDDPTRGGAGQPPENDPFGGNDGLNQARWAVGDPVQVYGKGFRNPYDVLLTTNGRLFTIDNGPNAGWGNRPINEGPEGNCTNEENELGDTQWDNLHYITGPGFYGGHPNPVRGNPDGIFGSEANSPVDFALADPVECDHQDVGSDGSLTAWSTSTNGMAEYTASNFSGEMQGDLLAAGWNSQNVYRVKLSFNQADQPTVELSTVLFSAIGDNPLDLTTQGDGDLFPGTIWVASLYGGGPIHVYEPVDLSNCTGAYNSALDEDGDGYDNADEIDNGTDPCNLADKPADFDQDYTSDLNDADDDNDELADMADVFPVDAHNGTTTAVPVAYTWDNDVSRPTGLLGLGFTGLMINGTADYLDLFDVNNMTAGGAGGLMTIDSVPGGTAVGSTNSQEYAFQFGISTATSLPFTAHAELLAPFGNITPQNYQGQGLFIGTGDQDNFIQLMITANNGVGGLRLLREVNGQIVNNKTYGPADGVSVLGSQGLELYLTVNPLTYAVQASYALNDEARRPLGDPLPLPEAWIAVTQSLAVGVIATSAGPGAPFTATWDQIEVFFETPTSIGSWTTVAAENEPLARHEHAFIQVDGKFYVLGGRGIKPVQIYDPVTNRWSDGAPPPLELHHFQAVEYHGMIAAVGAYTGLCCVGELAVTNIFYYNPASDEWTEGPGIPALRRRASAGVVVRSDKIYMVGGVNFGHGPTAVPSAMFDEYDPVTDTWKELPDAPRIRDHFHAALVDDKLYLIGGRDTSDPGIWGRPVAEIDVYDFKSGQWTTLPANKNIPTLRGATTTAVVGNEILIIGGESLAHTAAHNETEAFDTRSQTWRTLAPLNQGRHGAQVAVCNETLYIAAGNSTRGADAEISSLERFSFGPPQPCSYEEEEFSTLRINAGGPGLVSNGIAWSGDQYYSGGTSYFKAIPIANTEDDPIYHSERNGNFSYDIPVPNACYEVRLLLAETYWSESGQRLFNVTIEGELVLENYDLFTVAGGNGIAIRETFKPEITDGELNIVFSAIADNAKISALEIIRQPSCPGEVIEYWAYLPLAKNGS